GCLGVEQGIDRPLVRIPAVRFPAALQLRLPRRLDELYFRHRRRIVGAGRLDRFARALLAAAFRAVDSMRRRAVFLSSLRARYLWHRRALVRDFTNVGTLARTLARPYRRFRRQWVAVPRCGTVALCQPDHAARQWHLLGTERQDRRR